MMVAYLVLALLIAILAVVFALQNITAVTISFFAWQVSGSLSLILLLALAIGFLVGILVMLPSSIKSKMQLSNLRKSKKALEKEVETLRTQLQEATKPPEQPSAPVTSTSSQPAAQPEISAAEQSAALPPAETTVPADKDKDTPEMQ